MYGINDTNPAATSTLAYIHKQYITPNKQTPTMEKTYVHHGLHKPLHVHYCNTHICDSSEVGLHQYGVFK